MEKPRCGAALAGALAEEPGALTPLEALLWAFRSVEQLFEDNRPFSEPRRKSDRQHACATRTRTRQSRGPDRRLGPKR
jgi:hypothetical protein